nr:glyoxylate reductase/hydroxypyruvate reductase-like isoform X1 [Onthophagus taurus]
MEEQSKFKVLLTSLEIPMEATSQLKPLCQLIMCDPAPTRDIILEKCRGVEGIIWACPEELDKTILDATGKQLKIVSCLSNSVRHVAVKELKRRGVKLTNTPIVAADSIANIIIFLMLMTTRRFLECKKAIENNQWLFGFQWMLGKDIHGTTVGIVGFEYLGKILIRKLAVFGVEKFVYYGQCICNVSNHKDNKIKCCTFEILLQISDFVVICCLPPPINKKQTIVFNEHAFSMMKKTAILINVAASSVVDYQDLATALKNGTIFAAGLDVTDPEPLPSDHELLTLPNCGKKMVYFDYSILIFVILLVITPHIGSATEKTRMSMAKLAVQNILLGLNDLPLLTPI